MRLQVAKYQYPDLIRGIYDRFGCDSWRYADLGEMDISIYPGLLHSLHFSGWIVPVDVDGKIRYRSDRERRGASFWKISSMGLKRIKASEVFING